MCYRIGTVGAGTSHEDHDLHRGSAADRPPPGATLVLRIRRSPAPMPNRRCRPTAPTSRPQAAPAHPRRRLVAQHAAPRFSASRFRCRSRLAPIGHVRHAARRRRDSGVPCRPGGGNSIYAFDHVDLFDRGCRGAVDKPFWFQLYVMKDRGFVRSLIERAAAAKCSALVLTVDLQILGQRHRDIKNGLSVPPEIRISESHRHRHQAGLGARASRAASARPSAILPAMSAARRTSALWRAGPPSSSIRP